MRVAVSVTLYPLKGAADATLFPPRVAVTVIPYHPMLPPMVNQGRRSDGNLGKSQVQALANKQFAQRYLIIHVT